MTEIHSASTTNERKTTTQHSIGQILSDHLVTSTAQLYSFVTLTSRMHVLLSNFFCDLNRKTAPLQISISNMQVALSNEAPKEVYFLDIACNLGNAFNFEHSVAQASQTNIFSRAWNRGRNKPCSSFAATPGVVWWSAAPSFHRHAQHSRRA